MASSVCKANILRNIVSICHRRPYVIKVNSISLELDPNSVLPNYITISYISFRLALIPHRQPQNWTSGRSMSRPRPCPTSCLWPASATTAQLRVFRSLSSKTAVSGYVERVNLIFVAFPGPARGTKATTNRVALTC